MKKIILLMTFLIIITMNTGCLISKGKRRDAEEHFSSLSDLYPTKNVEDLFEKYPEGGTLSHSIFTFEEGLRTLYYYRLKVDSMNKTIIGVEEKSIRKEKFEDIYTVPVEYKNGEIIYLENPELENHKITFLFENLSYAELKRYKFIRSSYGYDSGIYSLSYYAPLDFAKHYMNLDEGCEPRINIVSDYTKFSDVKLQSYECGQNITKTFKVGE